MSAAKNSATNSSRINKKELRISPRYEFTEFPKLMEEIVADSHTDFLFRNGKRAKWHKEQREGKISEAEICVKENSGMTWQELNQFISKSHYGKFFE